MTEPEPSARNQTPVCVIVHATARLGREDQVKAELMKIAPAIRANPHNLDYRVYQDRAEPRQFVFYERWTREEAGEENLSRGYMADYIARCDDLYEQRAWRYFDEVHPVDEAH